MTRRNYTRSCLQQQPLTRYCSLRRGCSLCAMYGHHNSYLTTVEAKRVGVNCDKIPVAVLQWQSMVRKHCQAYKQIAVNYAARAFGVNRFNCTPDEAKLL